MKGDDHENEGAPLDVDFGAWDAVEPPAGFADRVMARLGEDAARSADGGAQSKDAVRSGAPGDASSRQRVRRIGIATAVTTALALAAAFALRVQAPVDEGAVIAADRTEVAVGNRARAVLEPGSRVRWSGDEVIQARGDVFYRVEPGARFRVHTPAGDVEVKGTCFRVSVRANQTQGDATKDEEELAMRFLQKRDLKVGAVGAAVGVMTFVGVYEGKVAVSRAAGRVEIGAGESATASGSGVQTTGAIADGQKAFEAKAATAGGDEPLSKANENLVAQIGDYRQRLEAIATQKAELETKLKATEQSLASTQDGAAPRTRHDFDLDADDWAELAKTGEVKYRLPCMKESSGWTPNADQLNKLALAPSDAPAIREAYKQSYERTWNQIKPMCQQALGATPDIIEKIGLDSCTHLIHDLAVKTDETAAGEASILVGQIRAGMRPEPGPTDKVHPVTRMFLAMTGANKAFEQDLAKSFGPEEAHRLAFADGMCVSSSRWGSSGNKKK